MWRLPSHVGCYIRGVTPFYPSFFWLGREVRVARDRGCVESLTIGSAVHNWRRTGNFCVVVVLADRTIIANRIVVLFRYNLTSHFQCRVSGVTNSPSGFSDWRSAKYQYTVAFLDADGGNGTNALSFILH